jgi:hypothetical protein
MIEVQRQDAQPPGWRLAIWTLALGGPAALLMAVRAGVFPDCPGRTQVAAEMRSGRADEALTVD